MKRQNAAEYAKGRRWKKRWQTVVLCLAAVVVFCTTYALILPAITLEKEPCRIPEHTHSDACYNEAGEPACGLEEHTHTEECNLPVELTEEEQAQVEEVITLIDALPTQAEMDETLAAFEDARG